MQVSFFDYSHSVCVKLPELCLFLLRHKAPIIAGWANMGHLLYITPKTTHVNVPGSGGNTRGIS